MIHFWFWLCSWFAVYRRLRRLYKGIMISVQDINGECYDLIVPGKLIYYRMVDPETVGEKSDSPKVPMVLVIIRKEKDKLTVGRLP